MVLECTVHIFSYNASENFFSPHVSTMYYDNKVTIIRSHWKAYKCRQKINIFSALPTDLWKLILTFIRRKADILVRIDHVIQYRLLKNILEPPRCNMDAKFQSLKLVHKYKKYLSKKTVIQALDVCIVLLDVFTIRRYPIHVLYINSTIESLIELSFYSWVKSWKTRMACFKRLHYNCIAYSLHE